MTRTIAAVGQAFLVGLFLLVQLLMVAVPLVVGGWFALTTWNNWADASLWIRVPCSVVMLGLGTGLGKGLLMILFAIGLAIANSLKRPSPVKVRE